MTAQCPRSQPTDAFRDLSRIFGNRDGRVLEFEILPPAFGPVLEDGVYIGITKKFLVQAFVVARRVFLDGLSSDQELEHTEKATSLDLSSTDGKTKAEVYRKLAIASEIVLLFACEHSTACNWRKRRLAVLFDEQGAFLQALDAELSLMTTFLCSPLHRHNKSPTLWQHRLWVQSHILRLRTPDFQAIQKLFEAELVVVLRAGELHPKNYYAFVYMRQIHRMLSDISGQSEERSAQLAHSIVKITFDWCLAHPADISSLMFLLYLLDAVPDGRLRLDTVGKVAGFAVDIGWEGESVWTFVDLGIRTFNLLEALGDAPSFPWSALCSSSDKTPPLQTRKSWRLWLDRARAHWVQPRSSN